jgi:hypothetical protein
MAVSITRAQQTSPTTWRVEWSSDQSDPVFYVWQDGLLINTTSSGSQLFTVAAGESLVVEIFDAATERPEAAFPGRLTLGWYATPATAAYRVDYFADGTWIQQARVREDGRGYYAWRSAFLADVTTHLFRVVPIGNNGNAGAPLVFSVLMVRHPDAPNSDFSYDAGSGVVSIT